MSSSDPLAGLKGQFKDPRWRLSNLYYITNKDGKRIKFDPTWAQLELLDNLHYQNLILKARQLGFCLDPSTRILTADLRWVAIADLAPGQEVVAVDEHPPGGRGSARKMRTATVEAVGRVYRTAYRISFDDGLSVVCTGQHPWLTRKTMTDAKWRSIEGKGNHVVGRIKVGTRVRWVTKPWEGCGYEDGWMAGMLDGEGSMALAKSSGAEINVSQVDGPAMDRMAAYLSERGYNHRLELDEGKRPSKFGSRPVNKLCISRMDEMFRLVGQTRPTRFVGRRFWEGKELPGKRNGGVGWATVTGIEKLGEQDMVDLQTSTGTYIAEGLVSHNTTFIEILMLDRILFNSNTRCGTIAHTLTDAMAIFADKVKYPYGQLPDQIRAARPSMKDSATELLLSNNSSIRVGTSLRSGTMQILHISEYGKICAKYPHKAREVRTGALNTVQAGQLIFIESTAEGQAGHFYEMSQEARAKLRTAEKLSTLDYKFHFFPWWKEPTYVLDPEGVVIGDGYVRYFRDLEHRHGIVLRPEQQAWYAKKADVQRGDMKREFPSTPDEAFEAAVEGAYYANEMAKAELDGRIGSFPHIPGLRVHTAWDIGRDTTSIWFFQVIMGRLRILRYYGTSGEGMPHFIKELRRLEAVEGYSYGTHFLPHDMRVKEWGSDKTRIEQMIAAGFIPEIARSATIDDGIEAVRGTLPLCEFDQGPTADGTKALKAYRKTWNEDRGAWSDTPYHDWASHPADAFRYLAISWRAVKETLTPEPYVEPTEPLINTVTVDRWHEIKPKGHKESIRV